ncbi:MAG: ABC transporter ATP-binding protein [Dehalococcoidia bacterium]
MRTVLRLIGYLRYNWRAAILAYNCLIGTVIFSVLTPLVVKQVIDAGIAHHNKPFLVAAAGLIVLVSLALGFFEYGQTYLGQYLPQTVALHLRDDLYDTVQRQSFAFHDRNETGQLMSRATVDVEQVRQFVQMGLLQLTYTLGLFVVTFVVVMRLNWKLGLIFLCAFPLISYRAFWTSRKLRPLWFRVQTAQGAFTAVLQENIVGARVVRAFVREKAELAKFNQSNKVVRVDSLEANRISAFNQPLMLFMMNIATAVILLYGGHEVIQRQLTLGGLVAFLEYRQNLAAPVRTVGFLLNMWSRASAASQRIFEILDAESEVTDRPGAIALPATAGHVRFENVSFGYTADRPILRNISIDALPGDLIALFGPSGSGKSTITQLLPRFYDVSSGRITIDGHDIREVTIASLRGNLGTVLQDPFLFSATIHDNIAYGSPAASREDIISVAKAARLHDFIETLPDGYETWVGERGVTLSGGQRQRVAIARTLLLDPKILILDDSTSSVDMETEYLIQQALNELMRGRTTFVIAQRLRTVRHANQILVLKDGEIIECGRHEELLALDGAYREIYDLELREQEELGRAFAHPRQATSVQADVRSELEAAGL